MAFDIAIPFGAKSDGLTDFRDGAPTEAATTGGNGDRETKFEVAAFKPPFPEGRSLLGRSRMRLSDAQRLGGDWDARHFGIWVASSVENQKTHGPYGGDGRV